MTPNSKYDVKDAEFVQIQIQAVSCTMRLLNLKVPQFCQFMSLPTQMLKIQRYFLKSCRLSEDDATIRGFVNDVFQLLGKPSATLDR